MPGTKTIDNQFKIVEFAIPEFTITAVNCCCGAPDLFSVRWHIAGKGTLPRHDLAGRAIDAAFTIRYVRSKFPLQLLHYHRRAAVFQRNLPRKHAVSQIIRTERETAAAVEVI